MRIRTWLVRLGRLFVLICLAAASWGTPRPVFAQTITVTTTAEAPGDPGDCTLGEAIQAAETNTQVDDCPAGGADDVIVLQAGATYTLTKGFDTDVGLSAFVITSTLTINGNGATLVRDPGTDSLRFFVVEEGGALTLNNLTLLNGRIKGEAGADTDNGPGEPGEGAFGGAIFQSGDVTLAGVTLEGNVAQGGQGGVGLTDNVGYPGGAGGEAGGGAIYAKGGTLTIAPPGAAFMDNQALGGAGGDSGTADVSGGNGGAGGDASGGAADVPHLVLAGGAVVFTGNLAWGGAGGNGGNVLDIGAGGDGGGGGAALGGGLAVQNDLTLTAGVLRFIGNTAQGGAGGADGAGSLGDLSTAGAGGMASGGGLFVNGALASAHGGLSFVNNAATGGPGSLLNPGNLGSAGGEARGGAVFVAGGGSVLAAAEFSDNRAEGGSSPVLADNPIGAAGQASGGAIYAGGAMTLTASSLISNTAQAAVGQVGAARGGALYLQGLPNLLDRIALVDNAALGIAVKDLAGTAQGGAVFITNGVVNLNNVTLSGNATNGEGGAVAAPEGGIAVLTHSTVVSNTAASSGGVTGTVGLINSVVAYNTGGNCGREVDGLGASFEFPASACGPTLTVADPQLGPLEAGAGTWFHMPAATSPLIDTFEGIFCPHTDQRGVLRPIGLACDSGAIEFGWAVVLPLIVR